METLIPWETLQFICQGDVRTEADMSSADTHLWKTMCVRLMATQRPIGASLRVSLNKRNICKVLPAKRRDGAPVFRTECLRSEADW